MESDELARVLALCRARDDAAWRALYDAHFDFVYRTARRLGVPKGEAEDVVHEVFVVVFRRLDDFQEGRLTTWLYRITANVVSHRHRRERVRAAFASMGALLGWASKTPERIAEERSAQKAVERVLERMSPKKREVFALFELEQLSGPEIAERVGVPVNTVWTRLHHARKEFLLIAARLGCLEDVSTRGKHD